MATSQTDILNTSYLHFDAFSMKDAIKKYLTEDSRFTDFVYEGSNLSVIIDLVALMYQCLLYNLNNTASESMFSDAQLYDSINRIVKLIGYNPRGYNTSVVDTVIENTSTDNSGSVNTNLPKYAFVNSGLKDSFANPIYYSTVEDKIIEPGTKSRVSLYNGIWKLYNVVNVAKGEKYETFNLTLASNPDTGKYIAYPYIDLYVLDENGNLTQWKRVDNIYESGQTGQAENSTPENIYELRLMEDGTYNIKCGDGLYGATFPINSELYVIYLQSNGAEGQIEANVLNSTSFNLGPGYIGISLDIFNKIFVDTNVTKTISNFKATNSSPASNSKLEETVDEIRENAPVSLSISNRLVTANDVEKWLKLTYSTDILDVNTMNNWQYITKFYAWLYNMGIQVYKNGQKYINSSILSKYDLNYTDAADCNSIYCWIKSVGNTEIQHTKIQSDLQNIKTLPCNVVLLPALSMLFAPCAAPTDYVKKYYINNDKFDEDNENYIEITINDILVYSPNLIKNLVKNAIISFFTETNFTLGTTVNMSSLLDTILAIPGISNVRTCFIPRSSEALNYSVATVEGLCFASWTNDVIEKGDDLLISTINRKLEDFQFPALYSTYYLDDKIKIITHNSNIQKA